MATRISRNDAKTYDGEIALETIELGHSRQ
jgi:hypothetical protein